MLYAKVCQEAESHGQSQQEAIFADDSLGRKQEIAEPHVTESRQKAKISGLVYTLL